MSHIGEDNLNEQIWENWPIWIQIFVNGTETDSNLTFIFCADASHVDTEIRRVVPGIVHNIDSPRNCSILDWREIQMPSFEDFRKIEKISPSSGWGFSDRIGRS